MSNNDNNTDDPNDSTSIEDTEELAPGEEAGGESSQPDEKGPAVEQQAPSAVSVDSPSAPHEQREALLERQPTQSTELFLERNPGAPGPDMEAMVYRAFENMLAKNEGPVDLFFQKFEDVQGPIPGPGIMRGYKQIYEDAPRELFNAATEERRHRHLFEHRMIDSRNLVVIVLASAAVALIMGLVVIAMIAYAAGVNWLVFVPIIVTVTGLPIGGFALLRKFAKVAQSALNKADSSQKEGDPDLKALPEDPEA